MADPEKIDQAARVALRRTFHGRGDGGTPGHSTDAAACWHCDQAARAVVPILHVYAGVADAIERDLRALAEKIRSGVSGGSG